MLIIQPIGGLCNRMRSINSAYMLAKERGEKLKIIWFCNSELNCPFELLFKKTADIDVINIRSKWNLRKLWYQFSSTFLGNEDIRANRTEGLLNESFRQSLGKRLYIATEEHFYPGSDYHLFEPTDAIQERILALTNSFGAYPVGVHIRRTDNAPAIGTSSTDAFVESIQAELLLNPDTVFYVATDDKKEEENLRNLFPGKIISNQNRNLSRDSVEGIQDAMLDLYSLAATHKIIGSFFSSFTDIAADMNGIPKVIAGSVQNNI